MKLRLIALIAVAAVGCERPTKNEPAPPVVTESRTSPGADVVPIETVHVRGSVHMLVGRGGNIGVSAGEDGVLIVDAQFAPQAPGIRAALASLRPGEPSYLLNTHHHHDHVGGNPVFGADAKIIAHDNVRTRLITASMEKPGLPVITFDRSLTLHFNGETIRAVHLGPGHTDGDSVIVFESANVVHAGDLFFNGRFPFVDLASGGSLDGLVENIRTLLGMIGPDTAIIPGHGPLATRADLETYSTMLAETIEQVRADITAGKSLAEIQKRGLPKWQSWSHAFISTDRWIETIHRSVTGQ